MKYREFKLKSKYQPTGDQPQAISQLVEGLKKVSMNKLCWV